MFSGGLFVNKKILIAIVLSIVLSIVLVIGLFLLSSSGKMAAISLNDYSLSEDGNAITLKVSVVSSIGYIRTIKEKQDGNKKYITFYSTYGLNSRLGAHNEFLIDLKPSINEIYFYRGDDGYVLILQKNGETNEWQKVR